ncbi:MAG: 16S rRNA (adenine(1518)-N(6)/adenine(1519)-N(6))-dimethyltransferase RsmA [Brevinematales bacterium]|nr:16S rRNA (adenine(1518)-N(6)/adenine(1519)-N(6))-dimethyltransferase RsmA [Brevinematales bacterium]
MSEIFDPFSLSSLKKIFKENGIFLSRSRGQNFLIDKNIAYKIIENIPLDSVVFEVGCGAGALTLLVASRGQKIYGVEIDKKVYELLKKYLSYKNLTLFHNDFLKFQLNKIEEKRLFFMSNLPYSISGEAIRKFIEEDKFNEGIIMLQKEFVERMLANPSTESYGLLSILTHFYLEVEKLFSVPKSCFFPTPEIDSIVVRIKKKNFNLDQEKFATFIKIAFSQRRKTIFNNLKKINFSSEELKNLSINPDIRPENLEFQQWLILFEYYQSRKSQA